MDEETIASVVKRTAELGANLLNPALSALSLTMIEDVAFYVHSLLPLCSLPYRCAHFIDFNQPSLYSDLSLDKLIAFRSMVEEPFVRLSS